MHDPSSEPTQTRVFRVQNAPKPPVGGPVWARGLRLTAGDQATGSEPPRPGRAEAAPSGIPRTLVFIVPRAREVEKPGARTGLFRLRRCSPGPRYPRCGYSASGQVFLHADEDRRCEAWRVTRFASMGPPSIDYSITLFGGEGNETHGSLSANNVVVVHVIAALGVR